MGATVRKYIGEHKVPFAQAGLLLLALVLTVGSCIFSTPLIRFPIQDGPREPWTLEEVQDYFTGTLPHDTVDLHFQSKSGYVLLDFKASLASALAFVQRLCFGSLYQGYDPFNARDDGTVENGYLIETGSQSFYFSYSPNTAQTLSGNRCFDPQRGGLQQILIDRADAKLYFVKYELTGSCLNPAAPHLCNSTPNDFEDRGGLQVNAAPQEIESRYARGDSWTVWVTPGANYEAVITLTEPRNKIVRGNLVHLTTIAYSANGNEPYCEACWVDQHGDVTGDGLKVPFVGSASGKTLIRIFWMGDPGTCTVQVRELTPTK